jgi:hypothetical protein
MKFRKINLLFLAFIGILNANAQSEYDKFTFYMDYYYTKPLSTNKEKPSYLCSYSDNNYLAINNILLKYSMNENFENGRLKVNFGLMIGTYSQMNLANESEYARSIYESNIEYKINKNFIFQYGIMSSHIGFESAIGIESSTATRSILADNSPYYENGARLNFESTNKKITANINYLNGWQMFFPQFDNQRPAWGHQIQYKPNKKITINSSSYVGPSPTNFPNTRYFHNFFAQYKLKPDLLFTLGFDNAMESEENNFGENAQHYFAPVVIVSYNIDENWSVAARYEQFTDNNMIMKNLGLINVHGFSSNVDLKFDETTTARLEARYLKHKEYESLDPSDRNNFFITGVICIKTTK